MLSHFFQTPSDSNGTLHLTLGFVGMHSVITHMEAAAKFSYLSFGVYVSDISRRISNLSLTVTYIYC